MKNYIIAKFDNWVAASSAAWGWLRRHSERSEESIKEVIATAANQSQSFEDRWQLGGVR
jgi:hypothetical protein